VDSRAYPKQHIDSLMSCIDINFLLHSFSDDYNYETVNQIKGSVLKCMTIRCSVLVV